MFDSEGPAIPSKIFEDIVKIVISFLVLYQTDKLMIPFLAENLETCLRSLYVKFIRKDVLGSKSSQFTDKDRCG